MPNHDWQRVFWCCHSNQIMVTMAIRHVLINLRCLRCEARLVGQKQTGQNSKIHPQLAHAYQMSHWWVRGLRFFF